MPLLDMPVPKMPNVPFRWLKLLWKIGSCKFQLVCHKGHLQDELLTSSSLALSNHVRGVHADFSLEKILGTASTLRVTRGFSTLSVDLVVLILGGGSTKIIMGVKTISRLLLMGRLEVTTLASLLVLG